MRNRILGNVVSDIFVKITRYEVYENNAYRKSIKESTWIIFMYIYFNTQMFYKNFLKSKVVVGTW